MSKAIKYGKNAALFDGVGNALINAFKQLNELHFSENLLVKLYFIETIKFLYVEMTNRKM